MANTLQLENAEVLRHHDYVMFKETATAQYWKSPVGSTAVLFTGGGWKHSGTDTVTGILARELSERLLRYHHRLVPKV
jgi:hypothetical protein